jgi:hypothetical protein
VWEDGTKSNIPPAKYRYVDGYETVDAEEIKE